MKDTHSRVSHGEPKTVAGWPLTKLLPETRPTVIQLPTKQISHLNCTKEFNCAWRTSAHGIKISTTMNLYVHCLKRYIYIYICIEFQRPKSSYINFCWQSKLQPTLSSQPSFAKTSLLLQNHRSNTDKLCQKQWVLQWASWIRRFPANLALSKYSCGALS